MWWFETTDWPARWQCGIWPWWLGWGTICSNLMITGAYYLIPGLMLYLIRKKPELVHSHKKLAIWFAMFVIMCGTTHAMDALSYWWPAYRFNLLVRFGTAVVSVYTLALLWASRLSLLNYCGPEAVQKLLDERNEAVRKLQATNRLLEAQAARDHRQLQEFEKDLSDVRVQAVKLEQMDDDGLRAIGDQIRKKIHEIRGHTPISLAHVIAKAGEEIP
jgi:hypothetical protein